MNPHAQNPYCWSEITPLIQRWRLQRNELLSILEASICPALPEPDMQCLNRQLKKLRRALVDYLSAGHFTVYLKVLQAGNTFPECRRQGVTQTYRKIESSTDLALAFNDKYEDKIESRADEKSFSGDLFILFLVLSKRFTLEEQLIDMLHEGELSAGQSLTSPPSA